MKTFYILFNNSTDGMAMYKKLKNHEIKTTISPTPRKLSMSCGISLMYKDENLTDQIKAIANDENLNYMDIKSLESNFNKNRGRYC